MEPILRLLELHEIVRVGHYAASRRMLLHSEFADWTKPGIAPIYMKITALGKAVGKTVAQAQLIWPNYVYFDTGEAEITDEPIFEKFNFLGDF